jgi:excisionase family DNA binding protein
MNGHDGERLTLKLEEAAALLGIGREKTRLLCVSGVIPSLRLGRRLIIPKGRFQKWLDDPSSQEALAAQRAS